MNPEPHIFFRTGTGIQEIGGPHDLIEAANLLHRKMVTAETMTRLEGEEEWKPFVERPEYRTAREMPYHTVKTRLAERAVKTKPSRPPPSAEFLLRLTIVVFGLLILCAIFYFMASNDMITGIAMAILGTGAALMGQCAIFLKLWDLRDESFFTGVKLFVVPFYDVYFFLADFRGCLPFLCAKYVGMGMMAGAVIGLAALNAKNSPDNSDLLHLYDKSNPEPVNP